MSALAGKVAFVAGADNVVGVALRSRLQAQGARVFAVVDEVQRRAAPAGVPAAGDRTASAHSVRPLDPASWQAAFETCAERHGRPTLVVNARHRVRRGRIADTGGEAFTEAFRELASANWLAQKHAILALRSAGGGVLVNVIPALARVAASGCAALCAAARGMLMSTKSAAFECVRARDGIIVSAVLAGRIEGDPEHWPDGNVLPRAPAVSADDVADGVLFLATGGSAYMTGVDLPVDGGFLAS